MLINHVHRLPQLTKGEISLDTKYLGVRSRELLTFCLCKAGYPVKTAAFQNNRQISAGVVTGYHNESIIVKIV